MPAARMSNAEAFAAIEALPFVGGGKGVQRFWHPRPHGDYETDVEIGRVYARSLVQVMWKVDAPYLLGWAMMAMVTNADVEAHQGVIVGFAQGIVEALPRVVV